MIRKIAIHQLIPGMYVVDLHKNWFEHNLWRRRFFVRDDMLVRRLVEEGITEVSIDTGRGMDLPLAAAPPAAVLTVLERKYQSFAERVSIPPAVVSLGEERRRAARLLREATATLQEVINAARAGRVVEAARLEPLIAKMIESVRRNPDALVPMARLKEMDAYATEHAIASTALIIALARHQGLGQGEIEKLALGALVKDVGQTSLDARLIAKPGQLSNAELNLVHRHVEEGLAVLEATTRLPETAVAVVLEHHERFDGSGYPYNMAGEGISLAGRMAAIADSYDAMTSDRPYRRALSPAAALRQVFDQGGSLFDPSLVAGFIHTIGVYPVGTLVRLESGHLAVVEELHPDQLLSPVVRVIYHAGRRQYVTPVQIDLARRYGNHYGQIVRAEDFDAWGLNPLGWQPA